MSDVIDVGSEIRALAFLPDRRLCVVAGAESTVQLRHLDGHPAGEPPEPITGVFAVATSKDGRWVVAGATDGFSIWDLEKDEVVRRSIGGVRAVDVSSDSSWVVTGSDDWLADVWDISTGERRPNIEPLRHEYNVISVKFCPCGERIVTATLFGVVRIFAASSGERLHTIPISVNSTLSVPSVTLAWSVLCSRVIAVSRAQVKCFNPDDKSVVCQWPIRSVKCPSSIVLSPNSKLIAYSINDTVVLRDTDTYRQIGNTLDHDGNVSCVVFSPRGDYLVAGLATKFTIWSLREALPDTYFVDVGTSIRPYPPDLIVKHKTTSPTRSCINHEPNTTEGSPPVSRQHCGSAVNLITVLPPPSVCSIVPPHEYL